MSSEQRDVDVSELPSVVFDAKSLLWWGTLGFMVIEGFTLLLMTTSYLYLRQRVEAWPPSPAANPDLLLPSLNTALLLVIIIPMAWADRAARRYDLRGVIAGLVVATVLAVPAVVLRWYDLQALNVSWETNAYGSAAWAVVVLHATLLGFDLIETGMLAAVFLSGRGTRKHYADVGDAALYQYYLSLIWVPLYLIVYWGPRIL